MNKKGLVSYSDSSDSCSDDEESLAGLSLNVGQRELSEAGNDVSSSISSSKLPLPGKVLEMFNSAGDREQEDSRADHGGRVRSFPHERGNWASCVFVPLIFSHDLLLDSFSSFLSHLLCPQTEVHAFPRSELHVSLSRTVPVPFHWIEPLSGALRESMAKYRPFTVDFSLLAYYSNDERTRSFLGLKVTKGHEQLCQMVEDVNVCFSKFRLPTFYENPSLHVSLYWCLGDKLVSLDSRTKSLLQEKWEELVATATGQLGATPSFQQPVTNVSLKSGNKLFNFPL